MAAARRSPATRLECCKPWEDLPQERKAQWPWQALHAFGHSRVTFSVETFMVRARLAGHSEGSRAAKQAREQAVEMLATAVQRKWIILLNARTGIYCGALTRRR